MRERCGGGEKSAKESDGGGGGEREREAESTDPPCLHPSFCRPLGPLAPDSPS